MKENFCLSKHRLLRSILYCTILLLTGLFYHTLVFAEKKLTADSIHVYMKRVADWQWHAIETNGWHWPPTDWTNGALYTGMMAWGKMAGEDAYLKKLVKMGEGNQWQTGRRRFFADDYCVAQTYSELYEIYRDPVYVQKFRAQADSIVALPHTESLEWMNHIELREWAWCDALFMGPPTFALLSHATGDTSYINTAARLWEKTTDYLYNESEHLYFRDGSFLNKKEKNGAKVFWSRGNGWVMAGLVRVLSVMPEDHPYRKELIRIYLAMSAKIASIQQPDGSWHASLLDPASFPIKETSGTGFYCYALTWGINNGLLSYNKYSPVVERAWAALTTSVHTDGKLGFVQAVGASPDKVTFNDTEVYGVGAFLLAGSEIYRMVLRKQSNAVLVEVSNLSKYTQLVTATVPWSTLKRQLKGVKGGSVMVRDAVSGLEVVGQVIYNGEKKPQTFIFQASLTEGGSGFFLIGIGKPAVQPVKVFGRKVPERKDDFAWENDRIAFRMYGPALEKTGEISNGLDIWVKNTDSLIINKWYKIDDYHKNHGEGLDMYKVGRTLGGGALAPYINGKLWLGNNYTAYKILDNGPIRFKFRLTYAPFNVGGSTITETRTISLDAGFQLNKIEDRFAMAADSMPVVVGIVLNEGQPVGESGPGQYYFGYKNPADGVNGSVLTGIVKSTPFEWVRSENGHYMGAATLYKAHPLVYYAGGGWDKSGKFSGMESWMTYLEHFSDGVEYGTKLIVYTPLK